jgi:hypothetical protein
MLQACNLRFIYKHFKLVICRRSFYSLFPIILIIAFAIELYLFSNTQDVWLDETTQLTGVKLTLFDMLRWLAGSDVAHFGVPADRMPPLSYLLDWSWLRLLGPSEVGFRLFHSVFVLGGVVTLAAATSRALGPTRTAIFLVFMVLSPKLISTGVEIRAYPIFFAVTCAQVIFFLRAVNDPIDRSIWPLALFAFVSVVAIYTHFFGVVSFGAFGLALGISLVGRRGARTWVALIVGIICILCAIGILPFVIGAAKHSGLMISERNAGNKIVIYLLKTLADASNMVSLVAAVLFFTGTLTLLAACTIGFYLRARKQRLEPIDWLVPVVIFGIVITVMTSSFVHSFDGLKASYSIWMFPLLGIMIASGWPFPGGYCLWWDVGRRLAAGALVGGAALSTYVFFSRSSEFIHGPRQFVLSLYENAESPKAIIYEPTTDWPFIYFPIFFNTDGRADQYSIINNNIGMIENDGVMRDKIDQISTTVANYRVIFLININLRTYIDIRRCNDDQKMCPQFSPSEVYKKLINSRHWMERTIERKFGLYDTQVRILEKVHE